MQSILHKLYETPEYTNIDALRDIIGVTLIQENRDITGREILIELLTKLKDKFPQNGYIGKNKGFFTEEEEKKIYAKGKSPITTTGIRGSTSSEDISNYSFGGFINYGNNRIFGTEIQAIDREGYEKKKKEDPIYKGKGLIALRMRGTKFDTIRGIFRGLEKHITLKKLNKAKRHLNISNEKKFDIGDLMSYYVSQGFLIPCKINGALVFSYSDKIGALSDSLDGDNFEIIKEDNEAFLRIVDALKNYDGSIPE